MKTEPVTNAGNCPVDGAVMRVAEAWRAWRRRRYWTQARQVEHLRMMLLADHRWLAADKTADALTERYLAALAPDWYMRQHEDTARLRSRLGLVPPQGYDPGPGPEPCKHRDEPRGCYRVRCQLGRKCVDA
jgi:hypothetical protein